MTPSSKGNLAFDRLWAYAEPLEQEANVGMFPLAICSLGELYMVSFSLVLVFLLLFFSASQSLKLTS